MIALLFSITAGVCHEEASFVERYALGLVADLAGSDDLEVADVNLRNIAFVEIHRAADGLALVSVARHIDVSAVTTQATIVGNVFRSSHSGAVRTDELHDVRPVDGNGDEIVAHLNDVVRRVANLVAVLVAEPLIAENRAILKVADSSVVCLPHAFVQEDEPLLRTRVIYK